MTRCVTENSIVVGVDGSDASKAALRWAAEQARALHAVVVAVHAWEPVGAGHAPYAPVAARPTPAEQQLKAAELLASTVRTVFGPRIGDRVRAVVVEGQPARVLLEQARGALLLALGHQVDTAHGRPALGPTGRACLRGAGVPVVAVPAEAGHPALRAVGAA
ncbi:universal stress protein UspA [Streptomyces sp. Act143]|uniref:universal stress protein n=1 Tax=Streptomyces sp. Act143 TaxID=2200760 RepID=UPI000D67B6F0|nr:universal stress protein [Streptomyces sp. Act143]PWI13259.1 universal stress protein UspA [Streptomyces sp. Act143]